MITLIALGIVFGLPVVAGNAVLAFVFLRGWLRERRAS